VRFFRKHSLDYKKSLALWVLYFHLLIKIPKITNQYLKFPNGFYITISILRVSTILLFYLEYNILQLYSKIVNNVYILFWMKRFVLFFFFTEMKRKLCQLWAAFFKFFSCFLYYLTSWDSDARIKIIISMDRKRFNQN
jgi:hypothetical protein